MFNIDSAQRSKNIEIPPCNDCSERVPWDGIVLADAEELVVGDRSPEEVLAVEQREAQKSLQV